MTVLVNVENMTFEDLIPYLENHHALLQECHDDNRENILKWLRELFNKLQAGETAEHYVIGRYMSHCLSEMGRVLCSADNPDSDHDFYLQPITKKELKKFLEDI